MTFADDANPPSHHHHRHHRHHPPTVVWSQTHNRKLQVIELEKPVEQLSLFLIRISYHICVCWHLRDIHCGKVMALICFSAALRKSCRPISWQTNRLLVQLAGRKFLPGSHGPNFPKYLQPPRADFPFLVSAENVGVTNSMTATECANAVVADFQSTLHKYGAILYRGFPIKDWTDFSSFFSELGNFRSMPYIGGAAPRKQVGDKVFTASDEPPETCIELHNEMAYMHIWPKLVSYNICLARLSV